MKRLTYVEIGAALGIHRRLASTLVKEEQKRIWASRDLSVVEVEKRRSIATYDDVIREAWKKLASTKETSLNTSGLLNAIISAQSKIDVLTGALEPIQVRVKQEESAREDFEQLFAAIDDYRATVESDANDSGGAVAESVDSLDTDA